MKKGILTVLLILLAFTLWTGLAVGNVKKEGGAHKPTHLQRTEPGQESFPEVVLPRSHAVRPTPEDFKREVLDAKGWTPEQVEAMKNAPAVRAEEEPLSEKELFYCRASGIVANCCWYRPTAGVSYLYCWGQVGIATLINLDYNEAFGVCPYPHYPFRPAKVRLRFYMSYYCTLYVESRIYGVDYSGGEAYPSGELCTSDQANPKKFYTVGTANLDVPLQDTMNCCVNGPFFAVFVIDNTDDFVDTTYCTPLYPNIYLSWYFDQEGKSGMSFWNPYGLGGSWYDVVDNGIESGTIYIQVFGYTADENDCPPPAETWYFKDPYPPGAPCGVPDFNQYQMPGQAFCGPTTGANSIWWFASRGDISLESADVPTLVNEIAVASNTNPVFGTKCDSLQTGILQVIKAHGGWWFEETTVYSPDFWYIQKELRDCEDVILLLGFWQTPDGGTTWIRFGGHFVTLAGVDIFNLAFAFSDPAMDKAETGGLGQVCGTHTPANDPVDHNTGVTSYDYYYVAWPSTSPGGTLYLPDYVADWTAFQDQNFRPEHIPDQGTYNSALPVQVEIEQVIVVSPGITEMSEEVQSSKSYEIENNHGGIEGFYVDFGSGYQSGLYYGTLIAGTDQDNLNCDYGDYYPVHTFEPEAPPSLDSFSVTGKAGDYKIYQLTLKYAHNSIPGLEITKYAFGFWVPNGGVENCEYAIEDVFVFHNNSVVDITSLQTAMWLDFDISSGGTDDLASYDQQHNSIWMYDSAIPAAVFGMTKKPHIAGDVPITGYALSQADRVYDGQYVDSLKYWMENLGWGIDNPATPEDKSIFIADGSFDLPAGAIRVEKWLKWGYGDSILAGGDLNWRRFLYDILHQEGYFRGDVNGDKKLSLGDIVYLIGYVFKSGPQPYEFIDQGDVNNDENVDLADIVYLINYIFRQGPAPIDKNRFLTASPYVDSTHKALGIRNPGLFGESAWMTLGK
jgi:hypothetical protein